LERILDGEHGGRAVSLCGADEAAGLIGLLEGIAAELSWQPGDQLRAYAGLAVHFAAYVDGALAGGLQLVPALACDILPCERVWPDVRLPRRERTAHISILAVRREYRGNAGLLWPLAVALWRHCAASGIANVSLEATPNTYRAYRRLGWPLEVVGDLRPHWGEDCLLCRMGVAEVAGNLLLRATRSATYRRIVARMGQALDVKDRGGEPTASCSEPPRLG
jgi:ribosomal protein S18 acetylase RimI-like enzyme